MKRVSTLINILKLDRMTTNSPLETKPSTENRSIATQYTFFPITDEGSYKFFKKQEAQLWNSNELTFLKDKNQYSKLTDAEKRVIDTVLVFFSAADGIICDNIDVNFRHELEDKSAKAFYAVQLYIETVHAETYSKMIDSLITDPDKKDLLFRSADSMECVRLKNEWMIKYMDKDLPIQYRMIAFAAAEGIFFTSSFLFIFWFRTKGVLQGIISANEMVARDESLHRDFACMHYKRMEPLDPEKVNEIIKEAVEIECKFVNEVVPEPIGDLSKETVTKFVKHIGDDLLENLGHEAIYNIPIDEIPKWMDSGMDIKQNFYEGSVTNYKTNNLSESLKWDGVKKANDDCFNDPSKIDF